MSSTDVATAGIASLWIIGILILCCFFYAVGKGDCNCNCSGGGGGYSSAPGIPAQRIGYGPVSAIDTSPV